MKKDYIIPAVKIAKIKIETALLAGSNGEGAHTDNPQTPGSAMGRQNSFWEDDDNEAGAIMEQSRSVWSE
ncbi:MAG: hypothetical protein K6A98_00410 [Prevotella sp.]|jgi:hypothetical protein|nr:hypothetical protein [Prevotella sp.]